MNYLGMNGNIGQYKGYDVYIVNYTEFKKTDAQYDIVYAVKRSNKDTFLLVLNDSIIGVMNAQGDIQRYRISKDYQYYTPPERGQRAQALGSIKYSDYTKTVDDFFEGLHELWKEMQV